MTDNSPTPSEALSPLTNPPFNESELLMIKDLFGQLTDRATPQLRSYLLLVVASELIDATAENLVQTDPGMKVVEFSLLAERVLQLANDLYPTANDIDQLRGRSWPT